MPIVRKLTAEEVAALERKGSSARAELAQQYDQFLIEFGPNEHGEIALDTSDSKLNIRNRLRSAAERRGLKLEFVRSNGLVVRFKVLPEDAEDEEQQELERAA